MNPYLLVAIAPNIYDWAFQEYLQDSPTWLKRGIVDIIYPQIYRRDFRSYQAIADKLVNQPPNILAFLLHRGTYSYFQVKRPRSKGTAVLCPLRQMWFKYMKTAVNPPNLLKNLF